MYSDPIKRADSNQLIPFNVRLYTMYIRFIFLCTYLQIVPGNIHMYIIIII